MAALCDFRNVSRPRVRSSRQRTFARLRGLDPFDTFTDPITGAFMTKSILLLPILALATAGMSACSEKAQNDASTAANSIAGDVNETARKARDDTDAALSDAETRMDNFGQAAGEKADRLGDDADRAADRLGEKADRVGDRAGAAARDIGNEIDN